jgi:hypothetical protein
VALFGRRRVPARAVPAALARPEKALRAERNDHGFLADDGLTINFEGYDLFDTNGTQLDVQHGGRRRRLGLPRSRPESLPGRRSVAGAQAT